MPAEVRQIEAEREAGLQEILALVYLVGTIIDDDTGHILAPSAPSRPLPHGQRLSWMCRSKSARQYFKKLCNGSIAPGAKAQNVRPGPSNFVCMARTSMSSILPCPSSRLWRIRSVQDSPSQQGVHHPQDSCAKKCSKFCANPTGQV